MSNFPIIAATIGDIGGIGPEVCLKAAASEELTRVCHPLLIGSRRVLGAAATYSGISRPLISVASPADARACDGVAVLDPGGLDDEYQVLPQPSAVAGRASLLWLEVARTFLADGRVHALIHGPVNSDSLRLATGLSDPETLIQPADSFLLRLSGALRIVSLTEHIPISAVARSVTRGAILQLVLLLDHTLQRWGIARPRIAVAGLNPHAVGAEERMEIRPAVEEAIESGRTVSGPVAPDSVFRMLLDGKVDAVVTMYHDQGQIALKTTSFEGACTVMIGRSDIQIAVPHGSAYEIAGRGIAQHISMLNAFLTAARLALGRHADA
jgi:4-hydroxy-L-threonine phosphate dehydrogenase PdxA